MTKQQIFETVANHLLTQNKKSVQFANDLDIRCAYRGDDGTKCAVGCLIKDEFYSPDLEGISITLCLRNHPLRVSLESSGIDLTEDNRSLLSNLQSIHDKYNPSDWKQLLVEAGANASLDVGFLK